MLRLDVGPQDTFFLAKGEMRSLKVVGAGEELPCYLFSLVNVGYGSRFSIPIAT